MKRYLLCGTLFALLLAACGQDHFISDPSYRAAVEADLAAKREALPDGDLFGVLDRQLSTSEREAITFLYAYMPLGDLTDYPVDYHLENYRLAERARRAMPWGKSVPEELFRHFVVPVRVNNENLDDARRVFYDELAPRVAGLSMYDAVLEVNHWCHEKAVYTPSDARTSSPLATVRTASGRCGEESTLLVAALRSVGIPARQVYTPRWAHTDDNHAWVEAWADGRWYFLGACEPEPVLNLGWFNTPASRGMLMHTKVFGRYAGGEEVVSTTPNTTEINVTANYADTASVRVTVTDTQGRPVEGARVEYKLYNYAELYPVAARTSDAAGRSSLSAGLGDLVVWASKAGRFGFRKVSVGKDREVVVPLDKQEGEAFGTDLDLTPPPGKDRSPSVTPQQRAENDRRMMREDSVRKAYTATFASREQAGRFAKEHGLDAAAVTPLLVASKGNHAVVSGFLAEAARAGNGPRALELLGTLSEKDLRDVQREVLDDHLENTPAEADVRLVLCPRVENEMLTPYKAFFRQAIPADEAERFRDDPSRLVAWCSEHIAPCDSLNAPRILVSPQGVWRARRADSASRDIFFVAVARSLGIAAWKDAVTGRVRYRHRGCEYDADFGGTVRPAAPRGVLQAAYRPIALLDNPKYYNHFTLSKSDGKGAFRLLNYEEEATWRSLLAGGEELESGYYMLVSGTRLAAGNVLARIVCLPVEAGRTARTELVMREDADEIRVIGSFDSEARFQPVGKTEPQSILQTTGRGYFIVGLLGAGEEPTNHTLRDLAAHRQQLEEWGRQIVLLFPSEENYRRFDPQEFPGLPRNISLGIDSDGSIRRMMAENMKRPHGGRLPLLVIADTFNRVVFFSEGYSIGSGEQLTKVIGGL